MKPIKAISVTVSMIFIIAYANAQKKDDPLFTDSKALDIGLKISIREMQNSDNDTLYIADQLYYRKDKETYDSVKAELKGRGHFRMKECYFPPLAIKFQKKDVKGTAFEGNKKLKLVLPCQTQGGNNDLVVKEFLCYKLYEVITPYCFKTRLVHIDFTEEQKKKEKNFQLKGILVEDDDKAAKRFDGKIAENIRISFIALQDTADLRLALFQYMISNTDWSSMFQHNIKLLQRGAQKFIPITYDFDMSGLVDAPYAVVSETSNGAIGHQQSVRDRLYRGWCRPDEITLYVRKEFLSKQERLLAVVDALKDELPDKEIKNIKDYLDAFFETLKDDSSFKKMIISACRSAE